MQSANASHPRAWLLAGGRWRPGASLPVTDRGMRYGMAVFETIAVRAGRALFVREHLALLAESAGALLALPAETIPDALPELDANDTGMLRIYVTAGDGSPLDPADAPRVVALFEGLGHARPDAQTARLHPDPVAPFGHGRKTSNYWMPCEAQLAARAAGFDHALLADHHGSLLSAAFGNVFLVLRGELLTPSLSLAVRPGVIRAWVMRQRPVRETAFPAARLGEASEIFITNSRLGVMPLHCGEIRPGPVGRDLHGLCIREKIVP